MYFTANIEIMNYNMVYTGESGSVNHGYITTGLVDIDCIETQYCYSFMVYRTILHVVNNDVQYFPVPYFPVINEYAQLEFVAIIGELFQQIDTWLN